MRAELCVVSLVLTACAPDLVIGEERRLSIRTAVISADGRWREAGERTALSRPGNELVPAAGWFGRSGLDGALPAVQSLPSTPSAVLASTRLGSSWIIAGHVGDRGFVRALDENDAQQWETTFGAEGTPTVVTAIATTNEGALVVAGTEGAGSWTALLEADGAVRWRRSFETDFQRSASGFVPVAIATDPGAPSPSRRQYWLTGTRARAAGDTPAYALQLTVDGDLWDSEPFAATGIGRGVATFDTGLAICIAVEGRVQLGWTQGGAVTGAPITEVQLDEPFELATCLATATQVKLIGTLARGADRIPTVVSVDRATRSVAEVREHPTARDVMILGASFDLDGEVAAFVHRPLPSRRWLARP